MIDAELGKVFLFEARQKRFIFDEEHFRAALISKHGGYRKLKMMTIGLQ